MVPQFEFGKILCLLNILGLCKVWSIEWKKPLISFETRLCTCIFSKSSPRLFLFDCTVYVCTSRRHWRNETVVTGDDANRQSIPASFLVPVYCSVVIWRNLTTRCLCTIFSHLSTQLSARSTVSAHINQQILLLSKNFHLNLFNSSSLFGIVFLAFSLFNIYIFASFGNRIVISPLIP